MAGFIALLLILVFISWRSDRGRTRARRRRACSACKEERLRSKGRWRQTSGGRWVLKPLSPSEHARRSKRPMPEHTCRLTPKEMMIRSRSKALEHSYRRRSLARNAGAFPWREWEAKVRQYDRCPGCARPWDQIRPIRGRRSSIPVDHVRPLSRGGSNDISNLQPLCHSCNAKKGNR
jgi:5-methylcytosine-specific restriction endonuclease McrA